MKTYTNEFSYSRPANSHFTPIIDLLTNLKSYQKLFIPKQTILIDTDGRTHVTQNDQFITRMQFGISTTYKDPKNGEVSGCYIPRFFISISNYKII